MEIDLKILWDALVGHKWRIFIAGCFGAVLAGVIAFWMPSIFRAQATLIVPQSSSQSPLALGLPASIIGGKKDSEVYIRILTSRTAIDAVIKKFDLAHVYKVKSKTALRNKVKNNLDVKAEKPEVIQLTYEDTNPTRSAQIVNYFIEQLSSINNRLAVTDAAKKRLFFERQLATAQDTLSSAENRLKDFQERSGILSLEGQGAAVITRINALKSEIAAAEIQLGVVKTYTTGKNTERQLLENKVSEMKRQLTQLEASLNRSSGQWGEGLSAQSTDYVRAMRAVKQAEAIYQALFQQYQAAQLEEAKESPVVQVLDPAIPPEKKVKPVRSRMVIVGFFMGLLFASVVVSLKVLQRAIRTTY